MKVTINETTYTRLKNLSFAPETELTGQKLPINDVQLDILTEDGVDISIGDYAELYDDLDNLWARYWIAYAERIDANTVRVRAQSALALLDRQTMPAAMYESEPVVYIFQDLFTALGSDTWGMDEDFNEVEISGYAPEQTARERLQWLCFVIGAYVRTYFTDRVWVRKLDDTETLVPIDKTFWKPTVTFDDWVTAIKVKAYSYTQGTPQTTDKWVEVQNTYYIQSEQEFTLQNPAAPQAAPENVITVDNLTLVNASNVSGIMTHLSKYYFKRTSVELDVINNASYMPGDKLTVYADENTLYTGFAESCAFSFGVQARATIRLTAADSAEGANLIITYLWDDVQIGRNEYTFPVGYNYSIQNPYIDWTMDQHRYIFRPLNAAAEGTIVEGDNEDEEPCAVALDLCKKVLHIISVDEVTEETDSSGDDTITIGVIA